MAGRPGRSGRRRQDHSSPLVDLDLVFADDRLIDRIAESPWGPAERTSSPPAPTAAATACQPARSELATADPLAELFETWRDELAADPMPALPKLRPTLVPAARRQAGAAPVAASGAVHRGRDRGAAGGYGDHRVEECRAGHRAVGHHPGDVAGPGGVGCIRQEGRGPARAWRKTALQAGRSRDAQEALQGGHRGARQDRSRRRPRRHQAAGGRHCGGPHPTRSLPQRRTVPPPAAPSPRVPILSTLLGSTAPSTLVPAPLVPATSSDPALADLAGGTVGAPAPAPAVRRCLPALGDAPSIGRRHSVGLGAELRGTRAAVVQNRRPRPDALPPSSDVPPSDGDDLRAAAGTGRVDGSGRPTGIAGPERARAVAAGPDAVDPEPGAGPDRRPGHVSRGRLGVVHRSHPRDRTLSAASAIAGRSVRTCSRAGLACGAVGWLAYDESKRCRASLPGLPRGGTSAEGRSCRCRYRNSQSRSGRLTGSTRSSPRSG